MITPGWIDCQLVYRDVDVQTGVTEMVGISFPTLKHKTVKQRRIQLSFIYPQNTIPGIPKKQVETYNTTLNNKTVFDILMIILKPIIAKEFYKPNLWLS